MAGFYNPNIWGPEPSLLAGDTTYNAMGFAGSGASSVPTAATGGGMSSGFGYAGLAMAIGGALTGAMGAYSAAKSQKSALQFQADIAGINARIAELGAQSALAQGERQIGALTLKAGQVKSGQRAAMAANGIDLGVGNAAEVQASTDIMKEIDANTVNSNAVRSAWGYRTQGASYQNDALIKRATADGTSAGSAATASLLGSAGSVAQNWYALSKAGAFN
ncbi:hypothetical protein [Oryzomicrobium sp.]|uniref:hypothetical protein n=1 Tax=Oryzomicrobium sp. TaxID=1911578 RepID=UPI002FE3809C